MMRETRMPYEQLRLASGTFVNPRTHTGLAYDELAQLAVHIGVVGLLNLPIVQPDGLVIAGSRRYRAIGLLLTWWAHSNGPKLDGIAEREHKPLADVLPTDIEHGTSDGILATAKDYLDNGVPVRVLTAGLDAGGIALADNVQRSDLSSYEIAQNIDHLVGEGLSQAEVSRMIGKSKTWVSRKLAAWRGAGPELLAAWAAGEVAEETVQDLAKLAHADQRKQLAGPVPRGRRGPANRPGIETVKEVVNHLAKLDLSKTPQLEVGNARYAIGVLDALHWIAGEDTSPTFAKLIEEVSGAPK